jgi:hypothetical protein
MTQIALPLKPAKAPTQVERLWALLQDGKFHSTPDIVTRVYGPGLSLARVAARIWDLKQRYGAQIERRQDERNPSIHHYRLTGRACEPSRTQGQG